RRTSRIASIFVVAGTFALSGWWGCGGNGSSSSVRPLTAPSATGKQTLDEPPAPDPAPTPDPAPAVDAPLTINIVGSVGATASEPNPLLAQVGAMIVWKNNDKVPHHIVLDNQADVGARLDGQGDLGNVAPGQSTTPVALTGSAVTYHCTIHPSMVGT